MLKVIIDSKESFVNYVYNEMAFSSKIYENKSVLKLQTSDDMYHRQYLLLLYCLYSEAIFLILFICV